MVHDHTLPSSVSSEGKSLTPESRGMLSFRLGAVLLIALAAFAAQFIGAILTGSIALLAESVHMLVDLIGLLIAFFAALLPTRVSPGKRHRIEAISALTQSTLLIGVGLYALIHGLQGLMMPHTIGGQYMLFFAAAGLAANLTCVAILYGSRNANINFRAAFLEVLSDALGSLLVIGAGIAVLLFNFYYADSIAALGLACLMVPRGVRILRLALRELVPGKLILSAMAGLLLVSLGAGLGVSQLHRTLIPPHLDLPVSAVDGYSWKQESGGSLRLTFDRSSETVNLTDGCSTARAAYGQEYGGADIGTFYLSMPKGCDREIPLPVLRDTRSAYYSDDFKTLYFYDQSDKILARFESLDRTRDQDRLNFWTPALKLLFEL